MTLLARVAGIGHQITRRSAMAVLALPLAFGAASAVHAQDGYPNRPVTIILPFGTGGVSDIIARTLAPHLEEALGQRFVVENMPGAGGMVATQAAFDSDQDGYTLLNAGHSATIRETMMPNAPLSQIDDFQPVSPVGEFGLIIVAKPDSGIGSVQDLVARAKAEPGSINVATVAVGSTQHLAALLFNTVAGIEATVVPYKSSPEAMAAVARGEADVAFEITAGAKNAIDAGQVVPIATTLNRRSASFPDLPSVEESGVAPYYVSSWNSYMTTKGVPEAVVTKLNAEIQKIIQLPDVKATFLEYGVEPYVGDAKTVSDRIASDIERWRKVITDADLPIQQ